MTRASRHRAAILLGAAWLSLFTGMAEALPATAAAGAKGYAKLRVAYIAPIGVMAPLWMAEESSAFQQERLAVEPVYIQASAAIAALLSGEVDALEISAPAIVPAVVAGGGLTMIAGLLNKMIFSLHAQREIKSAEQLRGKVVGTDRPGTPADYGGRVALTKLGLRPGSDVKLLRLGGSATLWLALQSGQIAAATLTPPLSFKADARGFSRLVDTYDLPYQNVGVVVRKGDVDERAELWRGFLRAMRRGIRAWYDDPKLALRVLAKYTKETDPGTLRETYEFFTRQAGFNRDLTVTDHGIDQIVKFLGSTVLPGAKDVPAERFYDTRVVDQIKE